MAITSARVSGISFKAGIRKYSVTLDLEVAEGVYSKHESAPVWEDSGDAAQAGERAVKHLAENGVLPDMSVKW